MADGDQTPLGWESLGVGGALLARHRADRNALVEQLGAFLEATFAGQAKVHRTLGVVGPKHITRLLVELGGVRYQLERPHGDALDASRTHVVRGVALQSESMPLDTWLEALGAALTAEIDRTGKSRAALAALLQD